METVIVAGDGLMNRVWNFKNFERNTTIEKLTALVERLAKQTPFRLEFNQVLWWFVQRRQEEERTGLGKLSLGFCYYYY